MKTVKLKCESIIDGVDKYLNFSIIALPEHEQNPNFDNFCKELENLISRYNEKQELLNLLTEQELMLHDLATANEMIGRLKREIALHNESKEQLRVKFESIGKKAA